MKEKTGEENTIAAPITQNSAMIDLITSGPGYLGIERNENAKSSAKDPAREVIDRLPDQATWGHIAYELYVKENIERGLADFAAGRILLRDEVKRNLIDDAD